ncbi:hypothetical protein TRVL_01013 [Trypanosoma vivax]|nr:hypothetical protein TRVL_01013 [Trypanosoma vivax]
MSDSVEISTPRQLTGAYSLNWFDAISRTGPFGSPVITTSGHLSANAPAISTGESCCASSPQSVPEDLTPSTIRYTEESVVTPVHSLSRMHFFGSPPGGCDSSSSAAESTAANGGNHMASDPPNRQRVHHDVMYEEAMRMRLAKLQWAAAERMRQSLLEKARQERDCTFKPQLSAYASKIRRPAHLAPQHRIHDELISKKEWRARKQRERIEQELQGCTFRPLTVRAAKLKSSALVNDSHIFSQLYDHHEEKQRFFEEVQPQVVKQMEQQVLFKSPADAVLPKERVNAVVNRLFSRGAVLANGEEGDNDRKASPRRCTQPSTQMPFRPTMNPESERIVSQQLAAGVMHEDVLERLTRHSPEQQSPALRQYRQEFQEQLAVEMQELRSKYMQGLRASLSKERRRTFISAKFDALTSHARVMLQGNKRGDGKVSVKDLMEAAMFVLSPEEADELGTLLVNSGMDRLGKNDFVTLCERFVECLPEPNSSALCRLPPPRMEVAASRGGELPSNQVKQCTSLREKFTPEEREMLRAKRLERQRQRLEEFVQQRHAVQEEEKRQCTFKPSPARKIPNSCRGKCHVEVRTTKTETLRQAHVQKKLEKEEEVAVLDLPFPLVKDVFGPSLAARIIRQRSASTGPCGLSHTSKKSNGPRTVSASVAAAEQRSLSSKRQLVKRNRHEVSSCHTSICDATLSSRRTQSKERGAANPTALSDSSLEGAGSTTATGRVRSHSASSGPELHARRDAVLDRVISGDSTPLTELGRQLILKQLREYKVRQR